MFAALVAAVMMIGTAAAQPQKPEGAKREKPTAEQMAKFRTERMAKALELSEQQQQQLYDYTLARINEAAKKSEAARNEMAAARKSNAEQMQKILTPEQYAKWTEIQKRQAEMGRAQGQRGGWHAPQGPQHGMGQGAHDGHQGHAPKHFDGKKHDGKCPGECNKCDKGKCNKCKHHKGNKGHKPAQKPAEK